MAKPKIDWTSIALLTIAWMVAIPVVVLLAVLTRGVIVFLFLGCFLAVFGHAKWKQARGIEWYD